MDKEPAQDTIEDSEDEYCLEIPQKIDPVKNIIFPPRVNIKQPVARTGFKRGQRR